MPHFLIRILVALVTFGVGLGASALWSLLGPSKYAAPAEVAEARLVLSRHAELATTPGVFAKREASSAIVHGGILNGKAVSAPPPVYPPLAMRARIEGTAVVFVVVGTDGTVEVAEPASGHPLLSEAAVEAVRRWRFAPTRLSGEPVKVSGQVTVNFTL